MALVCNGLLLPLSKLEVNEEYNRLFAELPSDTAVSIWTTADGNGGIRVIVVERAGGLVCVGIGYNMPAEYFPDIFTCQQILSELGIREAEQHLPFEGLVLFSGAKGEQE